jgi:hypothetical protein
MNEEEKIHEKIKNSVTLRLNSLIIKRYSYDQKTFFRWKTFSLVSHQNNVFSRFKKREKKF